MLQRWESRLRTDGEIIVESQGTVTLYDYDYGPVITLRSVHVPRTTGRQLEMGPSLRD